MERLKGKRWLFGVFFGLALAGLVLSFAWYYRAERARVQQESVEQLTAIGKLKAHEIAAWRAERLADAAILVENPDMAVLLNRYFAAPESDQTDVLLTRFRGLKEHYRYDDILLLDAAGQTRLSLSGTIHSDTGYRGALEEAIQLRKPVMTDLHAGEKRREPHLGVVAPVFSGPAPDATLLGALVLVCNANQFLFPLLETWPLPTETAETILVRRTGEQIRLLSNLRGIPGSALSARMPLESETPTVLAESGREKVVEARDYRKARVLAYVTDIPGSFWLMVAKQDYDEIFAHWQYRSRMILSMFLVVAIGLTAVALAFWHRMRKDHYKALLDAESRRRLEAEAHQVTLRSIGDAVISTDREGRVQFLNPIAETMTGWPEAAAVGRPLGEVFRILNGATRESAEDPVARVLREGAVVGLANGTILVARDGAERPIADSAAPIRDENGQMTGVVLTFRDQTTEQNYHALFRSMIDGFAEHELIVDPAGNPVDYRFLHVNPSFEQITGLRERDLVGRTVREALPGVEPFWIETYGRVVRTGEPAEFNQYAGALNKTFRVSAFRSAPNQFGTVVQDITDRLRVETALRESESRYRSLTDDVLDNTDVGIFILDAEFKVVWINKAMERFFGLQRNRVLGCVKKELIREQIASVIEDSATFVRKVFATYDNNSYTERFECHVLPAGIRAERWLQHTSRPILTGLYAGGRIEHYYDITDRKQAEGFHRQLATAIEQSSDIVMVTDPRGAIQYVNRAFEKITGYAAAEVMGKNPKILKSGRQDAAFYRTMWDTLTRGEVFEARMINRCKDGSFYTEDATISPVFDDQGQLVNYVAVNRDVTERLAFEAELQQVQKLESVGRLAGGVAHDFNNMLCAIQGYAELALENVPPGQPLHGDLQEILKAARRSSAITQQLLAFARKQIIAPRLLDLNASIEDMLKMLRRLIGENIELVWHPDAGSCLVKIDPAQLNQVLANLCVNARDAIADVGRISLATRRRKVDETFCADHPGSSPGRYVVLTISDTGRGMDHAVMGHLFEPFFTTKELGKGTGLGLATVHGIVTQNQGFITVYSEPDRGSTFSIYLPCHAGEEADAPPEPDGPPPPGQGETILLVEDEGAILRSSKIQLERLGYRVIPASGPDEALRLAGLHGDAIDLLVTDVVMPGMNGRDLADRLQSRYPGLACLFMSGYTTDAIAQHGILEPGVHFIQKPFSRQEVAFAIRRALEHAPVKPPTPACPLSAPESPSGPAAQPGADASSGA